MRNAQFEIRSSDVSDDLELIRLKRRFEKHLDAYRMHELEHAHREEQLLKEQENTARNIAKLYDTCKFQADSTEGLVELWNTANTIRKFVMWVMGFSGVGVFLAWALNYIKIGG